MQCPLCYSQASFLVNGDQREYHHCLNCRLIFVPHEFCISKKDELLRYEAHQNSLENAGYVKMFQEKIAVIEQICGGVKTVLDYGCGRDMVLKSLLTDHGYEVDGYDPNFLVGQSLKTAYDMVISTETFEHFKNPADEMQKIASLLAPSGYIAVMTQFYIESSPTAEKFNNWYYKRDPTHIAFYCTETFAWISRHLGFQIVFNNQKDFVVLQSNI